MICFDRILSHNCNEIKCRLLKLKVTFFKFRLTKKHLEAFYSIPLGSMKKCGPIVASFAGGQSYWKVVITFGAVRKLQTELSRIPYIDIFCKVVSWCF